MGSQVEINDTLQITHLQGFPKELVLEEHLKNPLQIGDFSEKVSADIDAEVSRIMKEAYKKAEDIITEYRSLLYAIAKRLIEKETIERAEFETILVANGVTPKKKLDIEHQG